MTPTVLIVDDRVINREFLSALLTYAGYRVVAAGDGAEAIDLARAWHPHLIVSDILMPTMDGVQLVRGLRADPSIAAIPVIFYTATYRMAEARALAEACGVSVVIPKPSEPEEILRTVADIIGTASSASPRPVGAAFNVHGERRPDADVAYRLSAWMRDLGTGEAVLDRAGDPTSALREPAGSVGRLHGLAMRLAALIEIGLDLSVRRQPQDLLDLFCRAAQDIVNARYAGVIMLENDGRRIRYLATRGLDDAQIDALRARFDPTADVLKQLLGNGGPQRLRDLSGDPTQAGLPPSHPPFRSFLAVPVQSAAQTYGLLYLAERLGADAFSEDDEQFAVTATWQFAPAYENLLLYQELRKYTDRLELEAAERRRATEKLRESEERYRLLWETTTDAIVLLDTENRIQHANAATREIFGYDPLELVGQDLGILQPERLREAHRRGLARYLETNQKTLNWRSIETIGRRRDDSELPIEIAFNQLSVGTRPIFVAYMRDITLRKRAEAALLDSRAFLEQSQEIGGIGSWMESLDDAGLWWSRETYRILGMAEDAVLTAETFQAAVHPDDRLPVAQARRRAVETRAPYSIDHRIVRADGGHRWVHQRADVVVDPAGGRTRLIGVIQDITERKEQQDRIARLTRIHAVLSGINSAIVRVHEREALYGEVCRVAVEAGGFPFAWVGAVDRAARRVRPLAQFGDEQDLLRMIETRMSLGPDDGDQPSLIARAVLEMQPMVSNDVESDARVRYGRELRARNIGSFAVLPLVGSEDVTAVLALSAVEAGTFSDEEMKLLIELASDISFGLQYIEKAERLDYLAYYDALTGLANGTLFHDRLNQFLHGAKSGKELVAVIILDLDRFTRLNDTLGRHVCDVVLQTVARRLVGAVPEPFSLGRIGGDTFAIAVAGLRRGADAATVLRTRVFGALNEPMRIESHEIRVSARAGIALFPVDGQTAAVLFKNAEAALQQARSSGERYLYYAPEINATVAEKLALENRLRLAAERQQFVLRYQVKTGVQDGRLVGLEALIRWNDPAAGLVLPESFIDVLEETGLILDVGRWVLDRAMSDYRRWRDAGLQPPRVAVNMSPLQLRQTDFVDMVRAAIEAHAAGPQALEIELTETLIMEDTDTNIDTLRRIKASGVTIAVDDFGTGYSSLRYLAKLPVDSLKIDRSFIVTMVNDKDSMTIVSTIISLAHSLGLRVVAEGVDSTEQALVLQRLGCDEMQGHLHGEAHAPEQVEAILRAGAARKH